MNMPQTEHPVPSEDFSELNLKVFFKENIRVAWDLTWDFHSSRNNKEEGEMPSMKKGRDVNRLEQRHLSGWFPPGKINIIPANTAPPR